MDMEVEERLAKLDSVIVNLARRFRRGDIDIEDLAQIGRIAAWEQGQKGNPTGYMVKAAEFAIRNKVHAQFAKKRRPEKGIVSLDAAISEDSESTLHDFIADKTEIRREEGSVIELLRNQFGKRYLQRIQGLDNPKKIVREIFRSAIEDFAKIPPDRIATDVDYNFFVQQGLDWPLWIFYGNSPAEAKLDLYPDLRAWQFKSAPQGYWQGKRGYKRAVEAVREFCGEKGIASVEDCSDIRFKDFEEKGLSGMLQAVFSGSPLLALRVVFPNLRKEDKKYMKGRFVDEDSVKQGLLEFLVERGVGNPETQTSEELYDGPLRDLKITDLRKRFCSQINQNFNGSAYAFLQHYFPNQIKPWLISGPHSGWRESKMQSAAEAVKWLFGHYFRVLEDEIPLYATFENIREAGFGGLLASKYFRGNIYLLINNAYPGRFNPNQFNRHRKTLKVDDAKEI